jgi:hypothetical protein
VRKVKTRKVRIDVLGMGKNRYREAGAPNWWGYWLDDDGDPVWIVPRGIPATENLFLEVEVPAGKKVYVGAGPRQYPGVRYVF